jgi:hypothetical protein
MKTRSTIILFVFLCLSVQAGARDLWYAPIKGYVNGTSLTIEGQVAEGFFNKMPESSIIKDPNATCAPTAITKLAGGVACVRFPAAKKGGKDAYECQIVLDLNTGTALTEGAFEECGEDDSFIREQMKEARKHGYWID